MIGDEDDVDLSTADRGNELPERDDAGRFVAKDAKPEDEDKGAKPEDEDEPEDEDKDAKPEDEDKGDDKDDEDDVDDRNLGVRVKKALRQRDDERAAREAAERRAAELQAQLEAQSKAGKQETTAPDPVAEAEKQLDALYEQVEEARAIADTKTAAKLQRQIDALNRDIATTKAAQLAQRDIAATSAITTYNRMADYLEQRYAALDPKSDDYDQELAAELNDVTEAFEARGMAPPAALRRAAKLVLREDPFVPQAAKTPEKPAKPEPKPKDVGKAVDTTRRQPPVAGNRGVNADSTAIDPRRLSDDEYNALPESKRRQLRGDFG